MAARILNADYLNKTGDALSDVKGSPFYKTVGRKLIYI